jgi:hypothetical protein
MFFMSGERLGAKEECEREILGEKMNAGVPE